MYKHDMQCRMHVISVLLLPILLCTYTLLLFPTLISVLYCLYLFGSADKIETFCLLLSVCVIYVGHNSEQKEMAEIRESSCFFFNYRLSIDTRNKTKKEK